MSSEITSDASGRSFHPPYLQFKARHSETSCEE